MAVKEKSDSRKQFRLKKKVPLQRQLLISIIFISGRFAGYPDTVRNFRTAFTK